MFSKVLLFCAAVAAVQANLHLVNTGVSARSRHQDAHGNYAFGYDIKDGESSNSRSEVGNGHGNKKGSYSQVVNHVAPVAVGHAGIVAPVMATGVIGYGTGMGLDYGNGMGLGYGNGMGHGYGNGMGLGYGNGMGLGYGNGMGLGYGKAIGIGYGNGMGLGYGNGIGLGYGAGILNGGIGNGLIH